MIGLTAKQSELLSFIGRIIDERNGIAPSFEEMKVALGLASKSGVFRLISGLEERGFIRRLPNRARALELVPADERRSAGINLASISADDLINELHRRGYRFARAA